jgi:hypothetical protein
MTTENVNIFAQATRQKLRFDTPIGKLSVEDLWDLPLTARGNKASLDSLAIELDEQLEKGKNKSFVSGAKKDPVVQLRFDIVKNIIDTKVAENKAKTEQKQRETEIAKITDTLAKKKDAALADLSVEALEARLLELKGGAAQ